MFCEVKFVVNLQKAKITTVIIFMLVHHVHNLLIVQDLDNIFFFTLFLIERIFLLFNIKY